MKKILIINGHPNPESYCAALCAAYRQGALEAGAAVEEIVVGSVDFDSNLRFGYQQRMDLEPELQEAWRKIQWADHLVWIYPVWWGSLPAVLKGFIDRVFLPGLAFRKKPNSLWWDKLLKGKSARIISTLDQPAWYYWLVYHQPSNHAMKKLTLEFCGIAPVRVTTIGPIRNAKLSYRTEWIERVKMLGLKLR